MLAPLLLEKLSNSMREGSLMHASRMFSRYSIFNFRNLCEITGFNPDGSPRGSNVHPVSADPFNQQPAEKLAVFNLGASGLGQTMKPKSRV